MIQITGLDHVVLRVADADASIRFYCEVLGCSVERTLPAKFGLIQLRAGHSLIDIVPVSGELGQLGGAAPGEEGHNMDHFCVAVSPWDEEKIRAHLESFGVEVGPVGERYGADGNGPSLYLKDPDGNTVELKGPGDLEDA
jgi:catechol 2,3-dioxygenase-like lactoylglutathione lyase family enzyme